MSHRFKRFAAFAIFALFYHFAAVDSILGFGGHHVDTKVDTKSGQHNDFLSLPKIVRLVSMFPVEGVHVPFRLALLQEFHHLLIGPGAWYLGCSGTTSFGTSLQHH